MFNPYHQWLDLPAGVREPNSYELLGLAPFESNVEAISQAAEDALNKVRSYVPGNQAQQWTALLDEVLAAKECLLDSSRKRAYDRWLSGQLSAAAGAADAGRRPASAGGLAAVNPNLYPPGRFAPASAPTSAAGGTPSEARSTGGGAAPSRPIPIPSIDSLEQTPTSPNAWPPSALPAKNVSPAQDWNYPPTVGGASAQHQAGGAAGDQTAAPQPAPPAPSAAAPSALSAANWPPSAHLPPTAADPMAPVATAYEATPPLSATYAPQAYAAGASNAPVQHSAGGALQQPMSAIPVARSAAGVEIPDSPQGKSRTASTAAVSRARQGMQTPVVVGVGVGMLMVLSAVLYVAFNRGAAAEPAESPPQVAQNNSAAAPFSAPEPPPAAIDNSPAGDNRNPAGAVNPAVQLDLATENTPAAASSPMVEADEPPQAPIPTIEPPTMTLGADNPAEPAPSPNQPGPNEAPADSPAPTVNPDGAPQPAPPEPAAITPADSPPTPEPAPANKPTRQEVAELSEALQAARAALADQDFSAAAAQLEKARPLARLEEHQAVVQRLALLADYVKQFRRAMEQAVSELDAGETFMVGSSTQVSFVEGLPDRIIVRVAGRNRMYAYHQLPPGLAVALAELALDQSDPVARVVKGAYLITLRDVDSEQKAKAREWWEEAQLGGVDLRELLPALDDDYDLLKGFTDE